ncbi:MAG: hypothetical protein HQL76_14325 [Magnetococcales bacterium]|nr:hypothetical protein [Magnetococcales bacterium]
MSTPFFLFLPPLDGDKVLFVGGDGGLDQVRREPAGVAAFAARGQRVILVVPGRDILLTRLTPPAGAKKRQLEKAVPFLLEDDLLSPVEQLHFSLGKIGADGRMAVAVVAKKIMDGWMAFVAEWDIRPQAMIIDFLLLPFTPGKWQVCTEEDQAWVRLGDDEGFMIERDNLELFLSLACQRPELPERIRWVAFDRDDDSDRFSLPVPVDRVIGHRDRVVEMVGGDATAGGLNLLQGAYRSAGVFGGGWQQARFGLILLAVWLVARTMIGMVELHYLEQREAVLKNQSRTILTEVFPDIHVIVNPKGQMMQRLEELKGQEGKNRNEGFMDWLTKVAMAARGVEGLLFHRVNYRDGTLGLVVKSPDTGRLERMIDVLTKQYGLRAVLRKADRGTDGVEGQIDIGAV